MPKFLHYFEAALQHSGGPYLLGRRVSYADLSLFHLLTGLRYAFPKALARLELPRLRQLETAIAARPRIKAYLASDRHQPLNQSDVFRHYRELDR